MEAQKYLETASPVTMSVLPPDPHVTTLSHFQNNLVPNVTMMTLQYHHSVICPIIMYQTGYHSRKLKLMLRVMTITWPGCTSRQRGLL